jgi:hypothetical protein
VENKTSVQKCFTSIVSYYGCKSCCGRTLRDTATYALVIPPKVFLDDGLGTAAFEWLYPQAFGYVKSERLSISVKAAQGRSEGLHSNTFKISSRLRYRSHCRLYYRSRCSTAREQRKYILRAYPAHEPSMWFSSMPILYNRSSTLRSLSSDSSASRRNCRSNVCQR